MVKLVVRKGDVLRGLEVHGRERRPVFLLVEELIMDKPEAKLREGSMAGVAQVRVSEVLFDVASDCISDYVDEARSGTRAPTISPSSITHAKYVLM